MRIEVSGRNVPVTESLRERVEKRFEKIARQVSELATLEVELSEEHKRGTADDQVVTAALHLKGVTLRAHAASPDMAHSINACGDGLAVQVKRHREKRRKRRATRAAQAAASQPAAPL
jgi:putative sigma-54 modulation protein